MPVINSIFVMSGTGEVLIEKHYRGLISRCLPLPRLFSAEISWGWSDANNLPCPCPPRRAARRRVARCVSSCIARNSAMPFAALACRWCCGVISIGVHSPQNLDFLSVAPLLSLLLPCPLLCSIPCPQNMLRSLLERGASSVAPTRSQSCAG